MIIISTHVHTLLHNYPPFSISTHVEVIIILKTKDFGKTIEKFWIAVRLRKTQKRSLSFCTFYEPHDGYHPLKTFITWSVYLMKCLSSSGTLLTIKMPINKVTLIYHLNYVNVFMGK